MTRTRRVLTLIGLAVAITVAGTVPASATFSETVDVSTSVVTGTVAAPTSVTVADWCQTVPTTTVDPLTGVSTTTYSYLYHATVSWPASTTARGVIGYRVMAHLNNGTSMVMAETPATVRTVSASVDQYYLQFQPRVSVQTLTSYGWTAESAQTPVLTC
jgi:hypothetical protein